MIQSTSNLQHLKYETNINSRVATYSFHDAITLRGEKILILLLYLIINIQSDAGFHEVVHCSTCDIL